MQKGSLLVIPVTAKVSQTKTVFQQHDQKIIINAPGSLMGQLVTLCDGRLTKTQIVDSLTSEWDQECVVELLDELFRLGLLIDPKYICEDVWRYATNPSRYARAVSDQEAANLAEKAWVRQQTSTGCKYYPKSTFGFGNLIEDRCSTRNFSKLSVEVQVIVDMLWSGYGECRNAKRTVPSAGALYPVVLYLGLMRSSGELSPGVYRVSVSQMWSVGFEMVSTDVARFQRAFMDPLMAEKAHGAVVIGGSLQQTAEKYGNRSMLYVPLEAGHVAQNIHLAAYSHNIATVEIGGFAEDMLHTACGMSDEYLPMTTILFGHPSREVDIATGVSEVDWVMPTAKSYQAPFAIAQARVSAELNEDWSYGRDASPEMAMIKAVSEAKEWAACGCVPEGLLKARLKDIPNAIDPRTVIQFHESQYELPDFPLEPFDESIAYEWVEGKDELTSESKHLLAELVYFPYFGETPPYLFANSSGVAAHPDQQIAIESSTLELIERDSFMIAYLTGLNYPTISVSSLPRYLQERISTLEQEGFEVTVKDHTLDLAPVVTVFVRNETLTYTNCASCSRFVIESAIDHALMEVEASVLARLQNGPAPAVKPSEVSMPLHHGALYEQKGYYRRADFMFKGEVRDLKELSVPLNSWDRLLDKLHQRNLSLITTKFFLSEQYGGNSDLSIVRSIVPGLVPMTFGYRQEPSGMKRLYEVARQKGKRLTYGNIRKFPHPFA
jgi:thiazole/oxazole-forming peptide maturase SagD family component